MRKRKNLFAISIVAAFATTYLSTQHLHAQLLNEDVDGELQVVLNSGQGNNEVHLATHRGVAEPISLHPDQWFPFILKFPAATVGSTVMLGCLDGGQLRTITPQGGEVTLSDDATSQPTLTVSSAGTIPFSFQAGQTLGLYRVVVQLPGRQYYLHFYLVDPTRPRIGIAGMVEP